MLSKKMQDAFNQQINAELYSSYLYLSLAAHFESANLKGFGRWMRVQAQEETAHGMKIYDFVLARGGKVTLTAIDAPKTEWPSPLAAFKEVYAHEQKVTALINGLVDVARKETDNAAEVFLHWFVGEQVEEEANASEIVEKLKGIKESANGLFMLDSVLGKRGGE